jgi:hypothetical protein
MEEIEISKLLCIKCSHEWIARKSIVFVCPKCKNPRWNDVKGEKVIKFSKNLSPNQILNIIINNEILSNELKQIGMVNHG